MWAAFPPRNLWFLAILSLALLAGVLRAALPGTERPGLRAGAWLGFVYGLAFFLPLLPWVGEYVGPLPWVALAVAAAGYTALFGVVAAATMRLPGMPLWFALSWVLVEGLRSRFPFGGFPWGRAAFSQGESPLLSLAAVAGAPGLSFAMALLGGAAAWLVLLRFDPSARPARLVPALAPTVALWLLIPLAAAAMWSSVDARTEADETVQVAAVQGNVPRLGLDFNAQRRAVLDNHVAMTELLGAEVRAGRVAAPDAVFWPENASDISPLANPDAAREIDRAADAVAAPVLVGTLLGGEDGRPTNTVLVWEPGTGPTDRYDKHIIQPFGEYLPWRGFFRFFSSYADLAGNFRAGTGPSVVTVPARTGDLVIGVATCWEIAFDQAARDSVRDGAELLYVPTNNATFGRTEMTYQQLAMSQVRAVEHGRATVVAATSGVSALINPAGEIIAESGFFTPEALSAALPLQRGQTLATRLGVWPEAAAMIISAAAFLFVVIGHTRFYGSAVSRETPGSAGESGGAAAQSAAEREPAN